MKSLLDFAFELPKTSKIEIIEEFGLGGFSPDSFGLREKFVKQFSWSIPCIEAINFFKSHVNSSILFDLMAGTGFWAKILNNEGIKTVAIDIDPSSDNKFGNNARFYPVKRHDAVTVSEKIRKINKPVNVLLSWIPNRSNIGEIVCKNLPISSRIFLMGEGFGGYCGSDEMFEYLNNNFSEIASCNLPNFPGIHDYLSCWEKDK